MSDPKPTASSSLNGHTKDLPASCVPQLEVLAYGHGWGADLDSLAAVGALLDAVLRFPSVVTADYRRVFRIEHTHQGVWLRGGTTCEHDVAVGLSLTFTQNSEVSSVEKEKCAFGCDQAHGCGALVHTFAG